MVASDFGVPGLQTPAPPPLWKGFIDVGRQAEGLHGGHKDSLNRRQQLAIYARTSSQDRVPLLRPLLHPHYITPAAKGSHPGDSRRRQNKGVMIWLEAAHVDHLAAKTTLVGGWVDRLNNVGDGR